ncbi:c-type cytochrome [Brevundimonas sp.]|uniref:c-type cytochrome n=1 Tax=Brevundimonas sp. TaxID=1871086 RepID=UPI002D2F96A1|nr:c-type cytochrome [Brevundimonas sp.]HYC69386.1 c-type cytochrome [Brevundimonas sp.]
MRILLGVATAALLAVGGCAADRAQDSSPVATASDESAPFGSVALGGNLVRLRCAGCHAVERTGDSPLKAAPPFREMGRTYPVRDLQEALAEGLVTAHPAMPQIELEPGEVADVIAYLESVSGTGGGGPN